jgi:hypothetical protein
MHTLEVEQHWAVTFGADRRRHQECLSSLHRETRLAYCLKIRWKDDDIGDATEAEDGRSGGKMRDLSNAI